MKRLCFLVTFCCTTLMVCILALSACEQSSKDFTVQGGVLVKYVGAGTKVKIPSSVKSIGESAFEDCNLITSITVPSSVTSIGDYAFDSCTSLTSIIIPSVTSIGPYVFDECTSLTSVTLGANSSGLGDWRGTDNSFNSLADVYDSNGKRAGTYTRSSANSNNWTYKGK